MTTEVGTRAWDRRPPPRWACSRSPSTTVTFRSTSADMNQEHLPRAIDRSGLARAARSFGVRQALLAGVAITVAALQGNASGAELDFFDEGAFAEGEVEIV